MLMPTGRWILLAFQRCRYICRKVATVLQAPSTWVENAHLGTTDEMMAIYLGSEEGSIGLFVEMYFNDLNSNSMYICRFCDL